MMKTKNMIWAALSMTAALVMTACSSDDNTVETPAAQQAVKTFPYSVTDGGVKAKFVLPVAKGTTLSSATVKMCTKSAISFGASQTLDGKVYNVMKTQAKPAATGHALSSSAVR